jgi:flagellin
MPAIINTNIASLNAQRNTSASQMSLTTSMQRLSSGLRVNSPRTTPPAWRSPNA